MKTETILQNINKERDQFYVEELKENTLLKNAAEKKTADMKKKGYFSHTDSDDNSVISLLPEEYNYHAIAENLAFGYKTEQQLIEAWMKSPTHKKNIIAKKYKDTGISVLPIKEKFIVAQVFGVQQEAYLEQRKEDLIAVSNSDITNHYMKSVFIVSTTVLILVLLILLHQHLKKKK